MSLLFTLQRFYSCVDLGFVSVKMLINRVQQLDAGIITEIERKADSGWEKIDARYGDHTLFMSKRRFPSPKGKKVISKLTQLQWTKVHCNRSL